MEIESCCEVLFVPEVLVEARGRKANFINPERAKFHRIRVDGCLTRNVTAADFIVTKVDHADVIVELKGRNVDHAIKQVEATLLQWRKSRHCSSRLAGLVVCNQVPKATIATRVKEQFMRKHRVHVTVRSGNHRYRIEDLVKNRFS
jgi:hypothetical protein